MARETATRRDEALRTVERAADFYGIPTRHDGAKLVVADGDREYRLGGGGGAGTLRAEAIVDGEVEAVVVVTPTTMISRLRRIASR
jgi:hypothetical protein